MIEQICHFTHNYFTKDNDKHKGRFVISDGAIQADFLLEGQYFRICGSTLNDGIYQYPASGLSDETFDGEVWAMKVPKAVIDLSTEISDWIEKYGANVISPYTSENVIGVYSYSKASTSGAGSANGSPTWQSTFATRLNHWRKLA